MSRGDRELSLVLLSELDILDAFAYDSTLLDDFPESSSLTVPLNLLEYPKHSFKSNDLKDSDIFSILSCFQMGNLTLAVCIQTFT